MEYLPYDFTKTREIAALYRACFGVAPSDAYFRWKYLTNPAGRAKAFIAIEDKKLAGFYGMIPENYHIDGTPQVVYQSMDTMTHPDFQRRGVFTGLARTTYDAITAEEGGLFAVGFPGETSYPGFVNKLQWERLYALPYRFTTLTLHRLVPAVADAGQYKVALIQNFNAEHHELFSTVRKGKGVEKVFDEATANWKYLQNPGQSFTCVEMRLGDFLAGIVCYKLENARRAFIHGVFVHPDASASAVIQVFTRQLFEHKICRQVFTFAAGDSTLSKAYRKNAYVSNPLKSGPFSYRVPLIVHTQGVPDSSRFSHRDDWTIQPHLRDY